MSLLAAVLAAAAIALHVPGQLSMDTSIQLEEARVGRSLSFNPPLMSALLRWLGGGEIATASCVLFSSLATYGAFAITARALLARRIEAGFSTVSAWRVGLVSLLLLNPVIFVYVGIVWKDVLMASTLMAGVSTACAAWASRGRAAIAWAFASTTLLAFGTDIRQQGIFMSPCLAIVPWAALSINPKAARLPGWVRCTLGIVVFLGVLFATRLAVRATIAPDARIPADFGYRVIMNFDLAGMVSKSPLPTAALAVPITEAQRSAVRASHASDRIDKVDKNPAAREWLHTLDDDKRPAYWRAMIRQNPLAYAAHRLEAFGYLLGFQGVGGCLPLCIGAEGNPLYLEQSGIPAVRDARDRLLYRIASTYFNWPIYRHWFWLLLLLAAVVRLWRIGPASFRFRLAAPIAVAVLMLYLSYLPTSLACDFRYLYPAIPLVSLIWCIVLLGGPLTGDTPPVA